MKMQNQSGFTLLEVLIALIVLSIGLLGIAGLQGTSKRTNFEAIQRTTAVMLARDIMERMRANSGAVASYTGTTITSGSLAAPNPNCASAANECTETELAADDLYEWQEALSGATETKAGANTGGLSVPYGCIVAGANPGEVIVTVAWQGLVTLVDTNPNTCGNALGNNRRLVELNTFITDVDALN